jgi:hypothetical protein
MKGGVRIAAFLGALALTLLEMPGGVSVAAGPDSRSPSPGDGLTPLARARLERHVDSTELAAWRDTCTAAEARAFDFLFAWLPSSDLAAWRADRVMADIRLALATRAAAPWRDQVDEETFLRFVLPHRVAQEPVQPWRPTLHALLWPRVRDLNLPEAILETNRFCREWATFQPSSARDQGPLATMARGLGRCEEEMIFFVCAARSVGIPARPCYTPWWTATDDNHAWVEAWAGDGWHYLGACEPEAELDRAWFSGPARRAGLVLSVAYGEETPRTGHMSEGSSPAGTGLAAGTGPSAGTGPAATQVYSHGRGVTLFNSTGVYATAGRVTVHWTDLDPAAPGADTLALRRAGIPVTIHVFNSGSLVPLGAFAAGDTLTLGPQDYFDSAAVDGRPAGAFISVRPNDLTVIPLDPRGGDEAIRALFARPFALRIPEPAAAPARAAPSAKSTPTRADSLRRASLARDFAQRRAASMLADSLHRVTLSEAWRTVDRRGADAVLNHLAEVPPRAASWLSFLLAATPREAADARTLVLEMDDKDFLEADSAGAIAVIRESARVRAERTPWSPRSTGMASARRTAHGRARPEQAAARPAVPDSIWHRFVLSPRIGDQPFDPNLWTSLPLLRDRRGRLLEAPAILTAFAARVRSEEPKRLGHLARPSETWASGWATPAAARVSLAGLFRRNGIPARVEAEGRWVEAWWGGRWVPCNPFDAASWDRREGEVAIAVGTPGHLRAVIRDGARVMTEAEPERHFRLARFSEGRFSPLAGEEYPVIAGVLSMDLEPGSWWLFGGTRGADGAPRGRAIPFTLAAGKSVSVDLDLGATAVSPAFPQIPPALGARAGVEGPVLLFAWKRHAEPSIRTAAALEGVLPEVVARGVALVSMPLLPAGADPGSGTSPAPGFPDDGPVRFLAPTDLPPLLGIGTDTELPVLLLADRDGAVLLRLAGMRPDAADLVRNALNRLDASGRARPE